ncbi:MAG: hypothetical protein JWO98_4325 [Frankiales bacterium]|nr:hypothetical protein [Frankiales bacterium]
MTGPACPPWCTNEDCDGNHAGEPLTAATGMSLTPGVQVSLTITPYHDQADEVDPEILLSDDWRFSDWSVQFPADEARRLGRALIDTADLIAPASVDGD